MASPLVNYASRVLSVDQESNSFVAIVGLNKAADMKISDAMMHAWNGCPQLRAAVDEDDMEVLPECNLLRLRHVCHIRDSRAHTLIRPSPAEQCCTQGACLPLTPTTFLRTRLHPSTRTLRKLASSAS